MIFAEVRPGMKVLAPSFMRHVARHRRRLTARVLRTFRTHEDLELVEVVFNGEPLSLSAYFEADELIRADSPERMAPLPVPYYSRG